MSLKPFSWNILDHFEGSWFFNSPYYAGETRATDWIETPEAHVLKVDVPGLRKEEVKVEVEDGSILQISGGLGRNQRMELCQKWNHLERSSGNFLRRFTLPANANMEQLKAAMENGVLTVTVPKRDVKGSKTSVIDISG